MSTANVPVDVELTANKTLFYARIRSIPLWIPRFGNQVYLSNGIIAALGKCDAKLIYNMLIFSTLHNCGVMLSLFFFFCLECLCAHSHPSIVNQNLSNTTTDSISLYLLSSPLDLTSDSIMSALQVLVITTYELH